MLVRLKIVLWVGKIDLITKGLRPTTFLPHASSTFISVGKIDLITKGLRLLRVFLSGVLQGDVGKIDLITKGLRQIRHTPKVGLIA